MYLLLIPFSFTNRTKRVYLWLGLGYVYHFVWDVITPTVCVLSVYCKIVISVIQLCSRCILYLALVVKYTFPFSNVKVIRRLIYYRQCAVIHDVIKWKHFLRYWTLCRVTGGFHSQGQWHGDLLFSLLCARTNGWSTNRDASYFRRHHDHYDVTVMCTKSKICILKYDKIP